MRLRRPREERIARSVLRRIERDLRVPALRGDRYRVVAVNVQTGFEPIIGREQRVSVELRRVR